MRGAWLGAVDPDAARRVAEEILADPRFQSGTPAPRPFAGFFRRLGELLVDPVIRFLARLGDLLPDVGTAPWLALATAVVAVAAVATVRLSKGREREHNAAGRRTRNAGRPDPGELERRADEAERRGDLASALRLRFRAGLARLEESGAVRLRPGATNGAVGRALHSARFDGLAGDFDEVAYGGRPATEVDLSTARSTWPAVLDAARHSPRTDNPGTGP